MIFRFLASDYPITLTVLLTIWLFARADRSVVRWMWNDRIAWARRATRLAIVAIAAFLLWATVVDNWRQLLGFLVDEKERWRSDPYLYSPPADTLRAITFVLLGLAVLGAAYLFARYARGYLIPILAGIGGYIVFFVLNSFRMRFELTGPLSERAVDFTNPGEAVMTFIWFAMFWVVMAILIFCAFAVLWGPATVIVALLYRSTIGRERITEPELYRILRERRASHREGGHHPT